jgi:hypothetical protein
VGKREGERPNNRREYPKTNDEVGKGGGGNCRGPLQPLLADSAFGATEGAPASRTDAVGGITQDGVQKSPAAMPEGRNVSVLTQETRRGGQSILPEI